MDENTFWEMIETARHDANGDIKKQTELLVEWLAEKSDEEIVAFDYIFSEMREQAYRADLWNAADYILNGCDNESFIHFRSWLIAQGKENYHRVLENIDNLADVIDPNHREFTEYEGISYIAISAYVQKTDDDSGQLPNLNIEAPVISVKKPPFGEFHQWDEYPALFPRLTEKFKEDTTGWNNVYRSQVMRKK